MDAFHLQRFVEAQAGVYDQALAELRRGRKTSHWMWFVLPQIAGLGHSAMSERYAIASLAEARAYLAHPVLGARLRDCVAALQALGDTSAERVMGGIDAQKLRSSLTLFGMVSDEPLFADALGRWFGGEPDQATQRLARTA